MVNDLHPFVQLQMPHSNVCLIRTTAVSK